MDGVERIMVLGILAVIVAILSFAWGRDGEADVVATDGGAPTAVVPLSSNGLHAPRLITSPPARAPAGSRIADPVAAQEQHRQKLDAILGGDGSSPRAGRGAAGTAAIGPQETAGTGEAQQAGRNPVVAGSSSRTPIASALERPGVEPPALKQDDAPVVAAESASPVEPAPSFRHYTVQDGETLWRIAYNNVGPGKVDAYIEQIQRLNPAIDPTLISVGQTIKLPPKGASSDLGARDVDTAARELNARTYVVATGDSLELIAERLLGDKGRFREIYELNRSLLLQGPDQIVVGQKLLLPAD